MAIGTGISGGGCSESMCKVSAKVCNHCTQIHNWHIKVPHHCAKIQCAKRINVQKSDNQRGKGSGQDCVTFVEVEHRWPSSIVRVSGQSAVGRRLQCNSIQ